MLERISRKLSDISRNISGKGKISEKNVQEAVEEIKLALLEADVNVRVVRRFVNRTIEEATGEHVLHSVSPGQQFVKIVHDRLTGLLGETHQDLELKGPDAMSVVLLMGLQGSGKTTTAAKLARLLKKDGRTPFLIAADRVRPAAIEQLRLLGEQAEVPVHTGESGQDAITVVKEGLKAAKRQSVNTVIVDTSGRLQVDDELMGELERVKKVAQPVESLLVADAMTGQGAVDVAKEFQDRIGVSGAILSKFDSDTRGGAALSLNSVSKTAIKFIGVGEKLEDLEPFYPERMASRILGMGDVVSLVEKAQQTIETEEAEELERKIASATFTLQDYLDQFQRVRKMGSVQSLIDMIPGMKGQISEDDIDEKEIKHEEAIILSMTPTERLNHRIIGPPRRKRIARGSGTSVYEVNKLLKKFDKMRSTMKKMAKNKKYQSQLMSQMGGV